MAQRRMFSLKIVSSDAFLDMPTSSRELYFQLGMRADDDGFVNPKSIVRVCGASEDDLKVLMSKRFVIPFENGVVVIKHWKINNLIRKDFYQETTYIEEKKRLILKENGAYTENVNILSPQYSIGKVSIGKDRLGNIADIEKKELTSIQQIVNHFFLLKGWDIKDSKFKTIYSRFTRPAKDLLELCDDDLNGAFQRLKIVQEWADSRDLDWTIETIMKKWYDLEHLQP